MLNELLPCPFCGKPPEHVRSSDHHGEFFTLGCPDVNCCAHWAYYTELQESEPTAIAAWNRRAKSAAGGAEAVAWAVVDAIDGGIDALEINKPEVICGILRPLTWADERSSVAGMPPEIPNEVCQAGMDAWQNTLGSPYTRYAAIYEAMHRALGGA